MIQTKATKNSMKKIKFLIILVFSLFLPSPALQANDAYSLSNYAEITTAALRGPLAALSHYNHGRYTKITKVVHGATDAVRLINEIFTLINHPNNINPSSWFWIVFDLANLHIDLFGKDTQTSHDDLINLTSEQTEIINILVKVSQTCLLPLTEGLTAFYRATNTDETPQGSLLRRQEQAFCSLSRAISVFLNHHDSKPAIILLLSALTETTLTLGNYPYIDVAPVPEGAAAEQNPVNNNNINLEDNEQQENNLDQANPQEPVEINQQNQGVHNQEHIENQVENNNQEELILPDHADDVLPIPDGDNHEQEIPIAQNQADHHDDHIEIINHNNHVNVVNEPLQNNLELIANSLDPQINITVGDHLEHSLPSTNINIPEPVIIITQGLNNANLDPEEVPIDDNNQNINAPKQLNQQIHIINHDNNLGINNPKHDKMNKVLPEQIEPVGRIDNNYQELFLDDNNPEQDDNNIDEQNAPQNNNINEFNHEEPEEAYHSDNNNQDDQQLLLDANNLPEHEIPNNQTNEENEEEIIFYDTFDYIEGEGPPLNLPQQQAPRQQQNQLNDSETLDEAPPRRRRRRKKRRKKQIPKEEHSFFDRLKFWKNWEKKS